MHMFVVKDFPENQKDFHSIVKAIIKIFRCHLVSRARSHNFASFVLITHTRERFVTKFTRNISKLELASKQTQQQQ